VILLALTRPPLFRLPWSTLRTTVGLGAVTGVLMQAGYLGGVWAAVKAGIARQRA